jgi:hypothetical protein
MAMKVPDPRFVPGDWAGQADWFQNWDKQMTVVGPSLGFSAAELTRIHDDYLMLQFLRDTMVAVDTFKEAVTNHRRIMSRGAIGEPTPALPAVPSVTLPVTANPVPPGIWQRNNEDVRRVREAPAYTEETGALLQIIPAEGGVVPEGDVQPILKVTVEPGYNVKVAGTMSGMDAIRIEYQRKGSDVWALAAFLTRLPGEFVITPNTPGDAESGRIRAVYIKASEPFGQFSPEYPITVS